MPLDLERIAAGTTYSMSFDFTSATEKKVLQYLQTNGYQLLAYRGASGPGQVGVGLPTWFALPFTSLFGKVEIDYTPTYKIYVFNQATIAVNTQIKMKILSNEVELGTAWKLEPDGIFLPNGSAPAGSIELTNERQSGTPNITVGLAGLVSTPLGQQYLPFCAFTMRAQSTIRMQPKDDVAMFAAQVDLQSGTVQANAAAAGCIFTFNESHKSYQVTVGPEGVQCHPPTRRLDKGTPLDVLNGRRARSSLCEDLATSEIGLRGIRGAGCDARGARARRLRPLVTEQEVRTNTEGTSRDSAPVR